MEPPGGRHRGITPPRPGRRGGDRRDRRRLAGPGAAAPHWPTMSTQTEGLVAPPAPSPAERQRPAADRFMRRLLRVEGAADPGAILGAQKAMTSSILVSAVR